MKGLCGRQEKGARWVSKNKNTSWRFRNKDIEMITNLGVRMKSITIRRKELVKRWPNRRRNGDRPEIGPPCSSHGLEPHPHQLFRAIAIRRLFKNWMVIVEIRIEIPFLCLIAPSSATCWIWSEILNDPSAPCLPSLKLLQSAYCWCQWHPWPWRNSSWMSITQSPYIYLGLGTSQRTTFPYPLIST